MKHVIFSSLVAVVAAGAGVMVAGSASAQSAAPVQPAQVQSAESVYGPVVAALSVPEGLTTEGVRTIVANCFAGREWTVRESAGNRVVGYLNHRGVEAQITAICDRQQIVLYSNSWKLDRSGRPVVPEQPERWIGNLKRDISKRLAQGGLAR